MTQTKQDKDTWAVDHTFLIHDQTTHRWETNIVSFLDKWIATAHSDTEEGAIQIARLLAAAPDLLEALKNMVREWVEIVGDEDVNGTPADTLEHAKAAIGKAEGKL